MKSRLILFLAISAILTLSFTFASNSGKRSTGVNQTTVNAAEPQSAAPVGGFISEDQL